MSDSVAERITLVRDVKLDPADIIRLQGEHNYTRIITAQNSYLVSYTLSWVMWKLREHTFLRVNKGHCINLAHVRTVFVRDHTLLMSNGDRVPVSRRKWKVVIQHMEERKGSTFHEQF